MSTLRFRPAGLNPLLTLLILLIWAPPAAHAQEYWRKIGTPTAHDLQAVWFTDSLHGWVGGDSGIVLSTVDGGSTWSVLRGADSVSVTDIFMIDTLTGWAVAIRPLVNPGDWNGSLYYRTTDGGLSWLEQSHEEMYFNSVFFLDSTTGWIGGEFGLILGTTDGGLTWSEPAIDSTVWSAFPVKRLKFFSRNYGYAVGGYPESAGVIWRTEDGGAHWTVTGLGDALRGIHFVDSARVILAGGGFDDGACMTSSSNGGASWSFSYVGPFGFATSLEFRTAGEGWAPLAFTGTSMFTADTGATWTEYQNPGGVHTYGVAFPDFRNGFMVGDSGSVFAYNTPLEAGFAAGWNIVSVPVETGSGIKDSLFPSAVSDAYAYAPGGYSVEDTLVPGRGYWLKFPSVQSASFFGPPRTSDSVAVEAGWNMVGSLSEPVGVGSVTTIPPGIIASDFFEFGNGYQPAAVLVPGRGYWIKTTTAGWILLQAAEALR